MPVSATITELASADASDEIGGKAAGLVRLIAAGAPVPRGVVITPGAVDSADLRATLEGLGDRFAVRSSSTVEDSERGAAPGVFRSETDVAPGDVAAAIERVRRSASSVAAQTYASAAGLEAPTAMPVIVQRWIPGVAGTLYTRAPGDDAHMMIASRAAPRHRLIPRAGACPAELDRLRELALQIEASEQPASAHGLDIEWVIDRAGRAWLVQCRSLPAPAGPNLPPRTAFAFARADARTRWRWDVSHNPEPLSVLQQELVNVVRERLGARLALACGYLYAAIDPEPEGPTPTAAELESIFFDEVEVGLETRLRATEESPPDLDAAIDTFVETHRQYARLGAVLGPARAAIGDSPGLSPGIGAGLLSAIAGSELFSPTTRRRAAARAARGEADYWAPYAERWDVASPCYDERPDLLASSIAHLPSRVPDSSPRSGLAAVTRAVAELDDRLFYRAQRQVRRAVLALPGAHDPAVRFGLTLATLRTWQREGRPPPDAIEEARRRPEPRRFRMPLEVHGESHLHQPPEAASRVLRGTGSGGQVSARAQLGAAEAGTGIIVARDLTAGEVLAALDATGIVLEGSHLLGHAAAMARELQIPIVTAVAGATTRIREGDRLWMDGDGGLVIIGGPPPGSLDAARGRG